MKKWAFIGLLFSITFLFDCLIRQDLGELATSKQDAVCHVSKEKDLQHQLDVLTNDLRKSTCILPRTSTLSSSLSLQIRFLRSPEKLIQSVFLRSQNELWQVSELVIDSQTTNFYTLLCRKGYYVYALRQLLI